MARDDKSNYLVRFTRVNGDGSTSVVVDATRRTADEAETVAAGLARFPHIVSVNTTKEG